MRWANAKALMVVHVLRACRAILKQANVFRPAFGRRIIAGYVCKLARKEHIVTSAIQPGACHHHQHAWTVI